MKFEGTFQCMGNQSDITQVVIAVVLSFCSANSSNRICCASGLGVALVAAGAVGCVVAGQTRLLGFDLGLVSVFAVAIGIGLFMKRRRFEQVD